MAWKAATLRPASLAPPCCPCNETSFARIIPSNDPAKIEAALLAEQKYDGNLHQSHGSFFHAKEPPSVKPRTPTDSDSESEAEDVDRKSCQSHYALNLDDISPVAAPLIWRMGSGPSNASNEDGDVEFLTACPGRPCQRITPVHCGFTFGSSGVCIIKALSSTKPTIIFIGNEPVTLRLGETHVLCYRTNRFKIGNLEYSFVYKLKNIDRAELVSQRNTILKKLGVPLPGPGLWDIPTNGERRIIGPAIMQACAGRGASKGHLAGVHLRSGEALAVKSLAIGDGQTWEDILMELQVLLSFQGAQGILQALEVRCTHGHRINHKSVQKQNGAVRRFCTEEYDTVYVITKMAPTNFRAYGGPKWAAQGTPFKVSLLCDILQGVKRLHNAGYMHRNISEHNVLIVSENPPVALLGGHGQSIVAKTSMEEGIGPAYIKAPEVGGTAYSNCIDIWNLGFVAFSMFFPAAYDLVTNFGGTQEEVWYSQMDKELNSFMTQGDVEGFIASVIRNMLDDDPNKRPSAAHALALLSKLDCEESDNRKLPKLVTSRLDTFTKRKAADFSLNGPSKKLQKRIDDGEIVGSDHGDDNKESVDSDDYETDDEKSFEEALKALRRLPSDGDLRDLLIALPAGVALPDVMARCTGMDAIRVKQMIRQGKKRDAEVLIPIPCHRRDLLKLRKCFGFEETNDGGNEESSPSPENAEVEGSGVHSKRSVRQHRREGGTLLIRSDRSDQKTDAGISIDEAEKELQSISPSTDGINTGPERREEKFQKVEYIDLEESEESEEE